MHFNKNAFCSYCVKTAAVIACGAIMLTLGSCERPKVPFIDAETSTVAHTQESVAKLGTGNIKIHYAASDSLNPYEATTQGNQQLSSLLFDPLVKLDENLNAKMMIADSIDVDGRSVIVRLKSVEFSDGSNLTADDVVYSLSQAKKASNGVYSDQLSVISQYSAASSDTVSLTLKHSDPLAANLLDFPIIKQGSTDRKTDDDKDLPPIGCGRYNYSDAKGTVSLVPNKRYYGKIPENKIILDNTPDKEALQYGIKSGEVDIYYSGVMTGELLSMSGKTAYVKQTNLVYLGLNSNGIFNSRPLRQAVSTIIGRSSVCSDAYYNYSEPALSLYNSSMNILDGKQHIFSEQPAESESDSLLTQAGYKSKAGYFVDKSNSTLTLRLLYNQNNVYQKNTAQLLEKQFRARGVVLSLEGEDYNSYINSVLNRDYDLYLAEIKLNKDFDYSVLFSGEVVSGKKVKATTTAKNTTSAEPKTERPTDEDGDPIYSDEKETSAKTAAATAAAKTENAPNEDMAKVYEKFITGKIKIEDFLKKFGEQMPFVPIAFRYGVVSYVSSVSPAAVATVSDAYYNIEYLSTKK